MKIKNKNNKFFIGIINITNFGYAFVNIQEFQKDIFIPKHKIHHSLEGDLVKIKIQKNINEKIKGEVVQIIKRNKTKFIGILKHNNNNYWKVIVKNYNYLNILIPIEKLQNYSYNEKVLVEIISWPKKFKNPLGRIIKKFGISGEYNTEFFSLLEEYHISCQFSKQSENETKKILVNELTDFHQNAQSRRDMRKTNTITIDPIDAKDFDDALSIKKLKSNEWEIGVHISDVSHYIREGSYLDKEAYSRATSIYVVGKVIPMLPKALSNNLCSLQPKKDRFCFSFIFNINEKGDIIKMWFGKTLIRSNHRFSYDEVQEIIDQKKGIFYSEICRLFYFSKIFQKKRLKNGSIYLDRNEVKFFLDEKKNPIKVSCAKNNNAHHLIEEFMILTNQKVSEFVHKIKSQHNQDKFVYIYRIHEKPDLEKILFLKKVIKPLGYFLDLNNIKSSINHLLMKIKGKYEKNMIENLILRSMSKAKYSTNNIGHYGLSFVHYTHFTSPIRRYSDIIAHRLLYHLLLKINNMKQNEKTLKLKSVDYYEKQSIHCSDKERLSIDIEREFLKYIQVKYFCKFLGKEFIGIITGFTKWSVYVDLLSFQTESMIKFSDIKEDKYILNTDNCSIIGKIKKRIYYLGDQIKVKLLDSDLEKKQIILDWIGKYE
ncbi:ribonuclease R [Blattabacterium cuenoti]|uniref:ribonuclease R n=1 Tax=Blattabacterium cuenoti TaxID=1653831 RepID=UPI00163CC9A7|nr:ribonuclease R [Blattabacterium cuenoti]